MATDLNVFRPFFKPRIRGLRELKPTTNNAVIYTRVSTKEQADNNMSLETQKRGCEEYTQKQSMNVLGYFGGTYESAKNDERKEFNRMLAFVKKSHEKISYIVVYSVDRFSRSGANAIYIKEQLKRHGILIQSVTQPVDAGTANGNFQQNIQIIFSEYDNQQRREKCMTGQRDALLRGEWVNGTPLGYDVVKTGGRRKLVINKDGKLIRKAFHWKAHERISNEEILQRLAALGLKIRHQKLAYIFRNPFYCGLIQHTALNGGVIEGQQEKLVSRELFLKVNEVLAGNTHGYAVVSENNYVPLKGFLKCGHCGSNLPGYIVKKKNLWYYKCRIKGCRNNKSAKMLHELFKGALASMQIPAAFHPVIKAQMRKVYESSNKENTETRQQIEKQLKELESKINRLEERFIMEEITREQFDKYSARFRDEMQQTQKQLANTACEVSNLDHCLETALEFCSNLPKLWDLADYNEKKQLQYLVFPEGISYDKKIDGCRTTKINPVFLAMTLQSRLLEQKKIGIPELNISYADLVVPPGIEPGSKV